jgi:uncharacterized pyridoxamine 5'-phosphate oxidase family protein
MIDYVPLLKANPNGVLATQNGEGVGTRVVQFQFADDNKLYFCTSSDRSVFGGATYGQLLANPNVSFCTYPADFNPVLSVNGKAIFVDDITLKTRIYNENPLFKKMFKTPDNPAVKLFYIDVKEVKTVSLTEGSKTYSISESIRQSNLP